MIKTLMAMLLGGAASLGGGAVWQQFQPQPPPSDFSALHADLVMLHQDMLQQKAAAVTLANEQAGVLIEMKNIMVRAEADRQIAQARAQAQIEQFHGSLNHTIQSIPR